MKKTEKIEIRVSPEEKEALSAASRSEGRTASDVLREYVGRYVEAAAAKAAPAKEKKMTWISKIAYAALGAAVSVPATMYAAAGDDPAMQSFEIRVDLEENPGQETHALYRAKTRIPLSRSEPTILDMPSGQSGGYQVAIIKEKNPDDTYRFVFEICRASDDGCSTIAAPGIVTAFGGDSGLSLGGAHDVKIDINIDSYDS